MSEFVVAFKYILAGFRLILKPGIRLYVLLPLSINTLLFAVTIAYGANQLGNLIDWISAQWAWAEWLAWLLWPLFLIVSLTLVFFCFSILANLISAPFNGYLARAVEMHLAGETATLTQSSTSLSTEIIDAFKGEFKKFTYFLIRALPLLLLFVIPFVQAVAPFIWFLFGAWILALEYIEYPMGNHGAFFPEVRKTLQAKRKVAMGYGIGVMLLTMLPIINFIAMPVAVCGATKLWLDKIKPGTTAETEDART